MNELVLDRRIVWNSKHLKQVDEAKAIIMDFVRQGYEVLLATGEKMLRFRPHLEEVVIKAKRTSLKTLKILSTNGDDRLVWDKENGYQAREAKAKFEELLAKSYKAYSVDAKGRKKTKISEFDVDAEEILMIPPTAKS